MFTEHTQKRINDSVYCTTLQVPLDYTDPNSEPLSLQLIKMNATNTPPKGSVLLNPGGPGASGIDFIADYGHEYREALGGKFDVVSFDPRWKTGRFISTPFVARDMLRVVDALKEDGLLRYWGLSYGATLGQTFAAISQNARTYYLGYSTFTTRNADDAVTEILRQCIKVGPKKCALADYAGSDTTPEKLSSALANALQDLLDEGTAKSLDNYLKIKELLFWDLYKPSLLLRAIKKIAFALNGDWKGFRKEFMKTPVKPGVNQNTLLGIACGDSSFRAGSPEELYAVIKMQARESMFADVTETQAWWCSHWKFEAAERYEGDFSNITTSFPIMFVNGPLDPVTPLSGAFETSIAFKGSRVLVQNGFGHGAMNHSSKCTRQAIQAYFEEGTLPKIGDVCEPDQLAYEYALSLETRQKHEAR
ncbi:TAP-like protein-domain-containing protein [Thelonectria olida]|uniref:TAP-like protein-domain-containing protein n=1 Tax=Thelonectria olida TaxID=1576542 RepID=A0A9P8VVU2_9HYPO|nr:TAP-like protein-domain-containing protein [Thelonectria olida]